MKAIRDIFIVLILLIVAGAIYSLFRPVPAPIRPVWNATSTSGGTQAGTSERGVSGARASVVESGLEVPWDIAFLPDGTMIATERQGRLRVFGGEPKAIEVPGVAARGEGGLHGIALHPDHSLNTFIYLYFTAESGGRAVNRVVRYEFDGETLSNPRTIIDDIPGSSNHNGGRIAFGPDELLYVTTGDGSNEDLAQDVRSLAGKMLRVHDDGRIPADNPFGNAVYSYGHRNPQGIAWDDEGNLWATEHGRSGAQSGFDELNKIVRGGNYGWPLVEGSETRSGMIAPALHSGPTVTWAPAGLAFKDGSLYFGGLRGAALYEVPVGRGGTAGELVTHYKDEFGRIRAVTLDPLGRLYISTSNRDGRGRVMAGDDKVLVVNPDRAE